MGRVSESRGFVIAALIAGVAAGGFGEAFLAVRMGYGIALVAAVVLGFAASHFCFGEFEMHLLTAFSIAVPALLALKVSLLLFAIPGALTGFMAVLAIYDAMDRGNQKAASETKRTS